MTDWYCQMQRHLIEGYSLFRLSFNILLSFLFEDEKISQPDKSQLTKCLEAFIEIEDFYFNETNATKTSVIVHFMSLVRKIPMKRWNTINNALAYTWKKITDTENAGEIHIDYNRYLESSRKTHKRLRRSAEIEPIVCQSIKTISSTCATSVPLHKK